MPSFVMTRMGPLVPLDERPLDDAVDPSESLAFGNRPIHSANRGTAMTTLTTVPLALVSIPT